MARIQWNSSEADRLLRSSTGEVARDLRAKALKVEARAKQLAPVDTGALRSSIHVREGRDPEGMYVEVGSDLDYAIIVELGSRPHVIRPKDKQALAWPGGAHPVKEVHHPGTEATPYLRPALEAIRDA